MENKTTLVIALAVALFISTMSFAQVTRVVTNTADDGTTPGSLRALVNNSTPGDIITFDPSITSITLVLGELVIFKPLTITGAGTSQPTVTINGNFNGRVFNITSGPVELSDLTITNGIAPDGGGIYMTNAEVTINNCIITNNSANATGMPAGSGGGIFNDVGGILVVNDSEISFNTANRAGGGVEDKTAGGTTITTTLNNVSLLNNNAGVSPAMAAPGNGGGIHVSSNGSVTITGGIASGNRAAREGGALWNGFGTMTVSGMTIDANDAQGAGGDDGGGGIFNNGGTLIVQNGTSITNNTASGALGSGGGIFSLTPGTLNVDGLTIENNTANRAGGGIEINSSGGETYTFNNLNLIGNLVNGPAPGNGGGLHISGAGNVVYNGGIVSNNTAFEGGGLWNSVGSMSVNGATIAGNIANGNVTGGGGLFNNGGILTVNAATTLTGNIASAATPGGRGGAIFNNAGGTINLANGLMISGNYASRAGGAIEDSSGGILTLDGVILTGNSAGVDIGLGNTITPNPGNGGGLHLSGTTNATITNSTIILNLAASEGGGLWNSMGSMTVDNTLIDANDAQGAPADNGGGGIFNNGGTLIVQNSTAITNNIASGAAGSGGGVFSTDGSVTINTSEISNNSSNRAGGGIELIEGNLNLINTTLDFNTTGSAPGNGGGLHITGFADTTIIGGTVNSNVAAREGGGLWNGSGTLSVNNVTIDSNIAQGSAADDGGAGIFNNGGTLNVQNATTITNNIASGASGSGGGIFSTNGLVTIISSEISTNSSNRAGGGIELVEGTLDISNSIVNSNTTGSSPGNGGGLHITGTANSNISGGTFNNNVAQREGGGLWNGSGIMTLDNVSVNGNTALGNAADDGGAGIFNNGGTLNITNGSVISTNMSTGTSASGGGLLSTAGDVTISNSIFDANTANRAGGAIELIDGTLTFTNSIMSNNDVNGLAGTPAPGNGGGFHVTGTLGIITISTSTITGNAAANEGGGLWNQNGTFMTISNSTIDNNVAGEGGGIYNNTGAITTVMTSTISGNSASVSGGGLTQNGASLDLNGVTIAQNSSAGNGGGIDAVNAVSLKNTIVALNTATSGMDVSGTLASNDYNLIGVDDLNIFTAQANDIEGVDPLIGPLQDNGGTTFTHQLLSSSPAFDAGDATDTFTDQIGQSVFGTARDIGAFESQMTLSVSDFSLSSILSVYPNPTNGFITIEIGNTGSRDIKLTVISITGKIVKEMTLQSGLNTMNLSGVASGLYILNLTSENNSVTHKLVLK